MTSVPRRSLLAGAASLFAWSFAPRAVSAAGQPLEDRRLLVLLLRGGLDGLAAVPAPGDPAWASTRGPLAETATVPLEGPFALNARMTNLAALWRAGEATIIHAVHTPTRSRSHFEAQDMLETGYPELALASGSTGWLNRAVAELRPGARLRPPPALALTATIPLLMRGPAPVDTWQPQAFPLVDADTVGRLLAMYRTADPALAEALRRGAAMDDLLGMGERGVSDPLRRHPDLAQSVATAARLMALPDGPRVAMMNMNGWDTHAGQGFQTGRIGLQVGALDAAIAALREALGPVWQRTAVLIVTEFGRTVRLNGSEGTDHGSATCAFLVGGAVRGGRVIADWPGLAESQLFMRRDLRPTTDLRSVAKGVLAEHLGVPDAALAARVFPDSAAIAPLRGLIRTT